MIISKTQRAVFEALINACDCSGGDGGVAFVSRDFASAANAFEAYLSEIGDVRWRKSAETEKSVCFWGGDQDDISFVLECHEPNRAEIVITAPYGFDLFKLI